MKFLKNKWIIAAIAAVVVCAIVIPIACVFGRKKPDPIESIKIDTTEAKLVYDIGEEYSSENLVVRGIKKSGSETRINDFNVNSDEFDSTSEGRYEITISYQDFTDTYSVSVESSADEIIDIVLDTTAVKTIYDFRETFSSENLVVRTISEKGNSAVLDKDDYTVTCPDFNNTKVGTYEVTVTYGDFSKTYNVNVLELATHVVSMSIDTSKVTREFDLNDSDGFNYDGLIVRTKTESGIESAITTYTVDSSAFDITTEGTYTIKVKYATFEQSYTVEVKKLVDNVESITLDTSLVKRVFGLGERFDSEGLIVRTKTESGIETVVNGFAVNSTAYNGAVVGNYSIIVTFDGHQETYTVSVVDDPIVAISVDTSLAKTIYSPGENFSSTGLVVYSIRESGTRTRINLSDVQINRSAFNANNTTVGNRTITVSYTYSLKTYTQTYTVRIVDDPIVDFSIDTSNVTKVFTLNDTNGFNVDGLIVRSITESNKETIITNSSSINVDSHEFDITKEGLYSIYVSYNGYPAKSYTVQVIVDSVETYIGIEINTTNVTKQFDFGSDFNSNGLVVYKVAESGNKYLTTDYIVDDSEFNSTEAGQYTIVVKFADDETITQSYEVTVLEEPVLSFEIDTTNAQKVFTLGEEFNSLGLVVNAVTESGEKPATTSYTVDASDFKSTTLGEYEIRVYCGEQPAQTYMVSVEAAGTISAIVDKPIYLGQDSQTFAPVITFTPNPTEPTLYTSNAPVDISNNEYTIFSQEQTYDELSDELKEILALNGITEDSMLKKYDTSLTGTQTVTFVCMGMVCELEFEVYSPQEFSNQVMEPAILGAVDLEQTMEIISPVIEILNGSNSETARFAAIAALVSSLEYLPSVVSDEYKEKVDSVYFEIKDDDGNTVTSMFADDTNYKLLNGGKLQEGTAAPAVDSNSIQPSGLMDTMLSLVEVFNELESGDGSTDINELLRTPKVMEGIEDIKKVIFSSDFQTSTAAGKLAKAVVMEGINYLVGTLPDDQAQIKALLPVVGLIVDNVASVITQNYDTGTTWLAISTVLTVIPSLTGTEMTYDVDPVTGILTQSFEDQIEIKYDYTSFKTMEVDEETGMPLPGSTFMPVSIKLGNFYASINRTIEDVSDDFVLYPVEVTFDATELESVHNLKGVYVNGLKVDYSKPFTAYLGSTIEVKVDKATGYNFGDSLFTNVLGSTQGNYVFRYTFKAQDLEEAEDGSYSVTLTIPVVEDPVEVTFSTTAPEGAVTISGVYVNGTEIDYSSPFNVNIGDTIDVKIKNALGYRFGNCLFTNLHDYENAFCTMRYVVNVDDLNIIEDSARYSIDLSIPVIAESITLNFFTTDYFEISSHNVALLKLIDSENNEISINNGYTKTITYGDTYTLEITPLPNYEFYNAQLKAGIALAGITDKVVENKILINKDFIDINFDYEIDVALFFKKLTWTDEEVRTSQPLVGEGTEDNPYIIANVEEFALIAYNINNGIGDYAISYYEVSNDIDFAGRFWEPIGTATNPFAGSFTLGEYEFTNITLLDNSITTSHGGLFGEVDGSATIVTTIEG